MRRLALLITFLLAVSLDAFSQVESFERAIHSGEVFFPMVMAMLAGILTSLSPCVYPLIPITLSIMGTRRHESHVQGFLVALSYVLGMSLVYCALGATFASVGLVLGSFMQHPAMVLVIASLFLLMALSMFGVFDVVLPEHLLTRLSKIGGQGIKGAFLMGMVAGLLAAPCTGPVLGFILTLIANERNILQGTSLMLAFSLGMGTPFLFLGTFFSALARLPKSGPWMNNIKYIFGATILGTAIYYFSLVWPELLRALKVLRTLGSIYLILVFIVALTLLLLHPRGLSAKWRKYKQIAGASLAAVTIASLLTFDDDKVSTAAVSSPGVIWHVIDSRAPNDKTFNQLIHQAKANGQPVLIDFYADWCVACKKLELSTFQDEGVIDELKRIMLIRVDATQSSELLVTLQNRFGVTGLPTIVLINKAGIVEKERILGFLPPEKFLPILQTLK